MSLPSLLALSFRFGNRARTASGGSASGGDAAPSQQQKLGRHNSGGSRGSSSGGGSGFFGGAGSSALQRQDAQMERLVANAARELGDGVQKIVLAAKARQGNSEWKSDLLHLLGNDPPPPKDDDVLDAAAAKRSSSSSSSSQKRKSDIDVLLENSKCERFVLRCVESELPPNLIHCLRLVRVLELQHTAMAAAQAEAEASDADTVTTASTTTTTATTSAATTTPPSLEPVARRATVKVSRLLCLLCKDASVGEQLRPHLFGLLALSGASYPPTGIHVAAAASQVIACLAQDCLTRQLVWFIHDRKMIMHMTDDIKELTGMTKQQQTSGSNSSKSQAQTTAAVSPSVPMGLIGAAAEEAGLWTIAFSTVIKLISASCKFQTIDLVKDFEAAGGYKVLRYAISNSSSQHGHELIELLPLLTCCPNEIIVNSSDEMENESDLKLAANLQALQIQEDLLHRSNPLLRAYLRESDGELPDPTGDNELLTKLALKSIETALILRASSSSSTPTATEGDSLEDLPFDVSSSLLSATLQIFSNHAENYAILEGRQHVLSYYLLAFPCFDNDDLKTFILKTLEFVLTGVGVSSQVTPVNASVEIFFALCQSVLSSSKEEEGSSRAEVAMEALSPDAELMGGTLEKLLQFDQRVAPLMVESGIMTTNLHALLQVMTQQKSLWTSQTLPPESTPLDSTFSVLCRVLKLLVAHQPVNFSKDSNEPSNDNSNDDKNGNDDVASSPRNRTNKKVQKNESTNLHKLLRLSIEMLGSHACLAAAGVFEAYMASFASLDALRSDMNFVLGIVDDLTQLSQGRLEHTILDRQSMLLSTLRSILEARSLARDAFRDCGGFQSLIRLLMSMKGSCRTKESEEDDEKAMDAFMKLLETIMGLLDASIGIKSRSAFLGETTPLLLTESIVVDSV